MSLTAVAMAVSSLEEIVPRKSMWALNLNFSEKTKIVPITGFVTHAN